MQPFTNTERGAVSVLSTLRDLDDRDKHKLLTVTTAVQEMGAIRCRSVPHGWVLDYRITLLPAATLSVGAELGTVTIDTPYLGMQVDAGIAPAIVFDQEVGIGSRTAVVPMLQLIIDAVSFVVDEFEHRFGTTLKQE